MKRMLLVVAVLSVLMGGVVVAQAASLLVTATHLTVQTLPFSAGPSEQTVVLSPVADAFVQEDCGGGSQGSTNFGSSPELRVQHNYQGSTPCPLAWTFLRFDQSVVPAGATIETAHLGFTCGAGTVEERLYEVNMVEAAWAESTITWNNQPPATGAFTNGPSCVSAGETMTFDVWPHVIQVHEGLAPDFGWAVEDPGAVCDCTLDDYVSVSASREAPADGPTLTITFEV